MNVINCCAGHVGCNIARYLAPDGNDVTVIDTQPALIEKFSDAPDVRGRIRSELSLSDGLGEIIEADALETSGLVGAPLQDARLPAGAIIGALIRDGEVAIPHGDTVVNTNDRVILFAAAEVVKKVEKKPFSVGIESF